MQMAILGGRGFAPGIFSVAVRLDGGWGEDRAQYFALRLREGDRVTSAMNKVADGEGLGLSFARERGRR